MTDFAGRVQIRICARSFCLCPVPRSLAHSATGLRPPALVLLGRCFAVPNVGAALVVRAPAHRPAVLRPVLAPRPLPKRCSLCALHSFGA